MEARSFMPTGAIREIARRALRFIDQAARQAVIAEGQKFDRWHRGGDRLQILLGRDKQFGRGVLHEIGKLGRRIAGVERQIDQPGPQARQIEDQRRRAFFRLHRHPVAGHKAVPGQDMGELGRARKSLAIADGRRARRPQEGFSGIGHRGHETGEEIVGHGARSKGSADYSQARNPLNSGPLRGSPKPAKLCFRGTRTKRKTGAG